MAYQNIVKMDANNTYSMLEDPNNVFPCQHDSVNVGNTHDGNLLFVYCSAGGMYSWDESNYFKLINPVKNLLSINVDTQNNLYSLVEQTNHTQGQTYCQIAFFNATNDYFRIHFIFNTRFTCFLLCLIVSVTYYSFLCNCNEPSSISLVPWSDGLLIYQYVESGTPCNRNTHVFNYFNPNTGQIEPSSVPAVDYTTFSELVGGAGNDLWAISYQRNIIYYYSASRNQWTQVNNSPFVISVKSIVWDFENNYLLVSASDVYLHDTILLKITTDTFPPSNPELLVKNEMARSGVVYGAVAIQQQNSENYGKKFFSLYTVK